MTPILTLFPLLLEVMLVWLGGQKVPRVFCVSIIYCSKSRFSFPVLSSVFLLYIIHFSAIKQTKNRLKRNYVTSLREPRATSFACLLPWNLMMILNYRSAMIWGQVESVSWRPGPKEFKNLKLNLLKELIIIIIISVRFLKDEKIYRSILRNSVPLNIP